MKKMLWIASVAFALSSFLRAQSAIDGSYYWETDAAEKYQKYVDVNVTTSGATISVSIDLVWTPGAHVEIGASAPTTQLVTQPGPGGSQTFVLSFGFEDGFKNKGTGKLTVNGTQCALSLTATETNDLRATRQYGDYSLQRQP
jgi:hypothetical protein